MGIIIIVTDIVVSCCIISACLKAWMENKLFSLYALYLTHCSHKSLRTVVVVL